MTHDYTVLRDGIAALSVGVAPTERVVLGKSRMAWVGTCCTERRRFSRGTMTVI